MYSSTFTRPPTIIVAGQGHWSRNCPFGGQGFYPGGAPMPPMQAPTPTPMTYPGPVLPTAATGTTFKYEDACRDFNMGPHLCKGHDRATCPKSKYHIHGLYLTPVGSSDDALYYGEFESDNVLPASTTFTLFSLTRACSKCLNGVRHSASDPSCPWQKRYQTDKRGGVG